MKQRPPAAEASERARQGQTRTDSAPTHAEPAYQSSPPPLMRPPGATASSNGSTKRGDSANTASVAEQVPVALREPLRYMLGRMQINPDIAMPRRIGVLAALHGEGTTTISRSFAALLADDLDASVCWVDLSWSRGAQPQDAAGTDPAGVSDVLAGAANVDDAIQTIDDRFHVLTAGTMVGQGASRLLRSPSLSPLLGVLGERFDHLVIDLPPVLASSESVALMRHIDAHLMVVRYGVTTSSQMKSASDEINAIPSIGVVINRFKSRIPRRLSHFFG